MKLMNMMSVGLVAGGVMMGVGCAGQELVKEGGPIAGVSGRDVLVDGFYAFYTSEEMTMDGVLDEEVWANADEVPIKYVFAPEGFEGEVSQTTAKLIWNDEYLIVGIECADKDVRSHSEKHDDTLWDGDVAEFFVKPSEDGPRYTEIVIAPNGAYYDGAYNKRWKDNGAGGPGWESEAEIGTVVKGTDGDASDDDEGYVVEFKVKLSKFTDGEPAKAGDVWRFGAFRYDFAKQWEKPLLLMNFEKSEKGFHYYEGYLPIRFVK
ncbi:hypothetical protein KS4_01260 [Poriferisphaera corsica]|uniref:Carbohydrate-binding domain-containing protein n=1 Tax=Poriferisphaera corsica TaxID=2528020 RepID=A0A517YPF4_9BACT|nr:carbohydrate-binding family 9-like protein [Poriferisphaera corsica]QDU32097.1 hypothetical protein KS4_01260 [Poriferisphaera corsica]